MREFVANLPDSFFWCKRMRSDRFRNIWWSEIFRRPIFQWKKEQGWVEMNEIQLRLTGEPVEVLQNHFVSDRIREANQQCTDHASERCQARSKPPNNNVLCDCSRSFGILVQLWNLGTNLAKTSNLGDRTLEFRVYLSCLLTSLCVCSLNPEMEL